jgi:hypothetical protein
MIPALLFWTDLSLGSLRRLFQIMIIPASVIALASIFAVSVQAAPYRFIRYNNVLLICALLALAVASIVPSMGKKYLVMQSRVSATGTVLLAVAVIHDNLSGAFLNLRNYPYLEPVALALFVFSQGWVAAEKVVADERGLLSIQNELAIAREIQASILPGRVLPDRLLKGV